MFTRTIRNRTVGALGGLVVAGAVAGMTPAHAATTSSSLPSVLLKIRYCESGNNYQAQNPGSSASGAYQFLTSTWRSLSASAGYATAASAPASVQDAAALELYNQAGTSPWAASQSCWGSLASVPTTTTGTSGSSSTGSSSTSTSSTASTGSSSSTVSTSRSTTRPVASTTTASTTTTSTPTTSTPTASAPTASTPKAQPKQRVAQPATKANTQAKAKAKSGKHCNQITKKAHVQKGVVKKASVKKAAPKPQLPKQSPRQAAAANA